MRFVAASILAVSIAASLALPGSASASSLVGDVNDDCTVNVVDLYLAASHYGYKYGSLRYSPIYDLDSDRDIDIVDLQIIASHAGDSC